MGQSLPESRPMIETDGNRSVVIAGTCSIALYSSTEMRIRCGKLTVRICGTDLELQSLDDEEIAICGLIMDISFLTEDTGNAV